MASGIEQQLKAIEKKLQAKIQDALENEVSETVSKIMTYHIESDVYDAYSPSIYQRRRCNGGLIGEDNIKSEVIENKLVVENVAMSNEDYLPNGKSPYKIAGSIEYGVDYDYFNPGARSFIANTRNDLKLNKQHISALKSGLRRNNVSIE